MSDQINYTQPEEHIRPDVRLAGSITGLNPFYLNNSASRQAMDASHVAQAVVLKEPESMLLMFDLRENQMRMLKSSR